MNTLKYHPGCRSAVCAVLIFGLSAELSAQEEKPPTDAGGNGPGNEILAEADQNEQIREVSPVRRIDRDRPPPPDQNRPNAQFRTLDGSRNNLQNEGLGSTFSWLLRWIPAAYPDGAESMTGQDRLGAREISNIVSAQETSIPNAHGTTDYLWQWGQFLDHDMDLTDGAIPAEPQPIQVPAGDPWFDPAASGVVEISFNRSLYDQETGAGGETQRQQVNEISSWIDASNVYGSDAERAQALRRMDGSGELRTSPGDLLPFNIQGLANAGGDSAQLFLAGDVRANEQVGLTSMHTLFVREHNRLARQISREHPQLDGEEIFQRARKLVGAEMQIITYQEYLPALLGPNILSAYDGYRPNLDASISNVFATAAYRYGHSALSGTLLRTDASGSEIAEGHLQLRDAFFSPHRIYDEGGIEPILRGLAAQPHQAIDPYVIDDVRNFLFGPPGAGGFDLASLNIQRGRDHGIASYNEIREAMGFPKLHAGDFNRISDRPDIRRRLREAYSTVDEIDAWVGMLAEDAAPGAQLGPTALKILKRQFESLRDGDRFWWQLYLTDEERSLVEDIRLSDVIRRNTAISNELQDNVFRLAGDGQNGAGQRPPPPPQ